MLTRHVLRKLYRRRCIGAKHTAIEHCFSGIPTHLVKEAKIAAQQLIKEQYILPKKTHYGLQVSLNPDKISEIKKILKD